jgi:hypothetical protein
VESGRYLRYLGVSDPEAVVSISPGGQSRLWASQLRTKMQPRWPVRSPSPAAGGGLLRSAEGLFDESATTEADPVAGVPGGLPSMFERLPVSFLVMRGVATTSGKAGCNRSARQAAAPSAPNRTPATAAPAAHARAPLAQRAQHDVGQAANLAQRMPKTPKYSNLFLQALRTAIARSPRGRRR